MIEKTLGLIFAIGGLAIVSIDYYIVKSIASIGVWLAELLNAPAGVGAGITVFFLVPLLIIILVIGVVGGFVIYLGLRLILE